MHKWGAVQYEMRAERWYDRAMPGPATRRLSSFLIVFVVYLMALAVGALVFLALPDWPVLGAALAADIAATLVVFTASAATRNSSMYDPYWSVAPPALGFLFLAVSLQAEQPGVPVTVRAALILVLVNLWGLRLTYNWARGWRSLGHQDWRYENLKNQLGPLYWPVSFLGIHLMPTLLTFLGSLPLYTALCLGTAPLGPLDGLGALVALGAIVIEATADNQLHTFRKSGAPSTAILQTGLWRYCRHPNYFGEMSFWWGLFLIGLAGAPDAWWAGSGALAITLLFVFITTPMIDKRMLARRPDYADWMKRVSPLVPLPHRRPR